MDNNLAKIEKLKELISNSKKICVFTGAGISVPSGIPDFRSSTGLYSKRYKMNLKPEEIISHTFFVNDTEMFYDFYKSKMLYPSAEPNEAHKYFANLEKNGKNIHIITQNIDGLHEAAGSKNVYDIHGSVNRNYCTKCKRFYDLGFINNSDGVPLCNSCGGVIKPDVVLYEESLNSDTVNKAINAISTADLLIVIGTSLSVYPAASFLNYFNGKEVVLINKTSTSYDLKADIVINEDIINVINSL